MPKKTVLTMGDDDRQIKYINVGIELTNKVTKKIMENLEGEEKEAQLQIMRNTMKVCPERREMLLLCLVFRNTSRWNKNTG